MKERASGMTEEAVWSSFLQADEAIRTLVSERIDGDLAEFGCGYGGFTIACARRTRSVANAFDLESDMVDLVRARAQAAGLDNVRAMSSGGGERFAEPRFSWR